MAYRKHCNTISTIIHFYIKLSRHALKCFIVTSYLVGYILRFSIVCLNITEKGRIFSGSFYISTLQLQKRPDIGLKFNIGNCYLGVNGLSDTFDPISL